MRFTAMATSGTCPEPGSSAYAPGLPTAEAMVPEQTPFGAVD